MKTLILSLVLLGAISSAHAALTGEEQAKAATLSQANRAKYTATREYVHRAEAIYYNGADALTLGRKPANIDTQYYLEDNGQNAKDADIVSKARDMSNLELIKGIRVVPQK